MLWRWTKFNLVGAGGLAVQLAVLGLLAEVARVDYLVATAAAVEAAVLHNFAWHRRWTWRHRAGRGLVGALARFHLSNAVISLAGNLALMAVLVGLAGLRPLVANLVAVAACSIANFLAGDRFVFASRARPAGVREANRRRRRTRYLPNAPRVSGPAVR